MTDSPQKTEWRLERCAEPAKYIDGIPDDATTYATWTTADGSQARTVYRGGDGDVYWVVVTDPDTPTRCERYDGEDARSEALRVADPTE